MAMECEETGDGGEEVGKETEVERRRMERRESKEENKVDAVC